MAEQPKRYHWLKLQTTYFSQLEQKKMAKQDLGKDMQIIYLRMMLLSVDKGGYIYYQGVYDSLVEELAEEFSESVEIVERTIEYLTENNMVTINESYDCFIPEALKYTGSECYSAERVRRYREKEREKALQCNMAVTECNTPVSKRNGAVTKSKSKNKSKNNNTIWGCRTND